MAEGNATQRTKNAGTVGDLEIIVVGVIVMAFCWWLFNGFGYWQLPGLAIVFVGFSELINKFYVSKTGKTSSSVRFGLLITFLGLAGLLSFVMFVVFGGAQIVSVIVMALGLIILIKGLLGGRK